MNTVSSTTTEAITNEITNTHKLILILYAKLLNHLVIKWIVIGMESKVAINTRRKLFSKKEKIMGSSELPKTFFIPISLVLDLAINRVSPNNPNADISIVKPAKINSKVPKSLSEEYLFFMDSSILV
jgi:hypothetical protein